MRRPIRSPMLAAGLMALLLPTAVLAQAPEPVEPPLEGTRWLLAELTDGRTLVPVADGVTSTLLLEAGRSSGSSGCNSFFGEYTLDGEALTFGLQGMTAMACPEPQMSTETAVIKALGMVATWAIADATLELRDAAGSTLLRYGVEPTSSLVGPLWVLDGYAIGDAFTSAFVGSQATLRFGPAELAGNTGCNSFSGPYTLEGEDQLVIGPLMTTKMACDVAVGEQEAAVLESLSGTVGYQLGNGRLAILDGSGAVRLTYHETPGFEGQEWVSMFAGDQPVPSAIVTLVLDRGRLAGQGPCNPYSGTYELDGSAFTVTSFVSTEMACADLEIETAYFAALQTAAAWELQSSDLVLYDASGTQVLRFTLSGASDD